MSLICGGWVGDNATNGEAERWVLWGDGEPPSGLDAEAGNDVAPRRKADQPRPV